LPTPPSNLLHLGGRAVLALEIEGPVDRHPVALDEAGPRLRPLMEHGQDALLVVHQHRDALAGRVGVLPCIDASSVVRLHLFRRSGPDWTRARAGARPSVGGAAGLNRVGEVGEIDAPVSGRRHHRALYCA
jgi:hypothetical protein